MGHGWTGGQYSVFRAVFGAYLFVHFAQLVPWASDLFSRAGAVPQARLSPLAFLFPNVLAVADGPAFVTAFVAAAAALSVLFAVGWGDRWAALGLWYVWACLFGRNPLIGNPGLPYVGWLLLAHAVLPRAPYGSLAARAARDAGATWRMPEAVFRAAWIMMSVGYSYSGLTKLVSPSWLDGTAFRHLLENPLARPGALRDLLLGLPLPALSLLTWSTLALEIAFAPLSLMARARKWLWSTMLALHLGLIFLVDFTDLSLGMVMLHFFTFDPAWVPGWRRADDAADLVFYDGACSLCHGSVRFLAAEDGAGRAFRFAPLGGARFRDVVPARVSAELPDSLVVVTSDERVLTRSDAVVHVLGRLGGLWRVAGAVLFLCPRPLRDGAYDLVAAVRRRVAAPPAGTCPVLPPFLRARFEA